MTTQMLFDSFILSRKLADLSTKTITNYIDFVQPFVDFVGHDSDIQLVNDDMVNQYIELLIDKSVSKSTRSTYIRHVKVFLKWVSGKNAVSYDYKLIRVPKNYKKRVQIYSLEEVQQIFNAVDYVESDWLCYRNKTIIALMYDSGLRQAEVCTLRRDNVSFINGIMQVTGKGNKTRVVPLGKLTAEYMKLYLDACPYNDKMVFVNRRGEPLTCNAVKKLVRKLAEKLPFELSSHRLRHNFATNYCLDQYEKHGQVDVYKLMALMGHEEIETTENYLHFAMEIICAKGSISHLDKLLEVKQ